MAISLQTNRLLLSKSGGFCANPSCNSNLFQLFESGAINSVEEMAHIIAQSQGGPRGGIPSSQIDEYENLILLCPTCHTKIDKNSKEYTIEALKEWKDKHEERINSIFLIPIYSTREAARNTVEKRLIENESIFLTYGPHSKEAEENPLSDYADTWRRKAIETILPNNRYLVKLIAANYSLLNSDEKPVFEEFKRHVEDFEFNKLSGEKISNPIMFPNQFKSILSNG